MTDRAILAAARQGAQAWVRSQLRCAANRACGGCRAAVEALLVAELRGTRPGSSTGSAA